MKSLLLASLLYPSLAFAHGPAVADRNAAVALQEHCFDAFVRVRAVGRCNGSGVFIHSHRIAAKKYDNFVLTSYHVVDDADKSGLAVDTVSSRKHGRFTGRDTAKLVSFDEKADVAVLVVRMTKRVTTLQLATDRDATPVNSPLLTIGCSNSDYPTIWSDTLRGTIQKLSPADWQTEATPIPGRSGGPLLNANAASRDYGRVLGVCIRIHRDGSGIYSDLEATRAVVRAAGLPPHVVHGGPVVVSPTVLLWLVIKLSLAVVAQVMVTAHGESR